MKFIFLFLFFCSTSFAQSKGLEKMMEQTSTIASIQGDQGFNKEGRCPELPLRMKTETVGKRIHFILFIDQDGSRSLDEKDSSVRSRISVKRKLTRLPLKVLNVGDNFKIKILKDSNLYFTADFINLTGTILADVEDIKQKKTYSQCTYYIQQEIRK